MLSKIIHINNRGSGFPDALDETVRMAQVSGLSNKESLHLRLCAEEMLSLARSVTGEMEASFWLDAEGKEFALHMTTQTVMDKEKRYQLLSSATSRKNEAANTFLGKLRDVFEEAMTADADHTVYDVPFGDVQTESNGGDEWDRYERSILRRVADNVKIAIRGGMVEMTVAKKFA